MRRYVVLTLVSMMGLCVGAKAGGPDGGFFMDSHAYFSLYSWDIDLGHSSRTAYQAPRPSAETLRKLQSKFQTLTGLQVVLQDPEENPYMANRMIVPPSVEFEAVFTGAPLAFLLPSLGVDALVPLSRASKKWHAITAPYLSVGLAKMWEAEKQLLDRDPRRHPYLTLRATKKLPHLLPSRRKALLSLAKNRDGYERKQALGLLAPKDRLPFLMERLNDHTVTDDERGELLKFLDPVESFPLVRDALGAPRNASRKSLQRLPEAARYLPWRMQKAYMDLLAFVPKSKDEAERAVKLTQHLPVDMRVPLLVAWGLDFELYNGVKNSKDFSEGLCQSLAPLYQRKSPEDYWHREILECLPLERRLPLLVMWAEANPKASMPALVKALLKALRESPENFERSYAHLYPVLFERLLSEGPYADVWPSLQSIPLERHEPLFVEFMYKKGKIRAKDIHQALQALGGDKDIGKKVKTHFLERQPLIEQVSLLVSWCQENDAHQGKTWRKALRNLLEKPLKASEELPEEIYESLEKFYRAKDLETYENLYLLRQIPAPRRIPLLITWLRAGGDNKHYRVMEALVGTLYHHPELRAPSEESLWGLYEHFRGYPSMQTKILEGVDPAKRILPLSKLRDRDGDPFHSALKDTVEELWKSSAERWSETLHPALELLVLYKYAEEDNLRSYLEAMPPERRLPLVVRRLREVKKHGFWGTASLCRRFLDQDLKALSQDSPLREVAFAFIAGNEEADMDVRRQAFQSLTWSSSPWQKLRLSLTLH